MTTFFLALGFLRFLKNKKFDLTSLLSFTLALFTFYGSLFFVLSLSIYLFFAKQKKEALKLFLTIIISFLILLPLVKLQIKTSKILLETVKNWSAVLEKANLKNLALVPIKFSIGRISFYPKPFYYTLALIWTTFVFSSFKNLNKNYKTRISTFIFFTTLIFIFSASFIKPMLQYFRVLYLIVPLSIILSESSKIKKLITLTGFLIFSPIYLLFPTFHREDWKNLVKDLRGEKRVYIIPQVKAPLEYYAEKFGKKIEIRPLKETLQKPDLPKNSIIIPYAAEIFGIEIPKNKFKIKKAYRKNLVFIF